MDEFLADLDESQREAVSALHGPVAVLAGAGSGKTRTLTHRAAHGISSGVFQENRLLMLTFTSKAAEELRQRLAGLGFAKVQAKTFHAAALSQLQFFWPQLTKADPPRILKGKAKLIAEAAELNSIKVDTAVLRDVAAEIEWRKVNLLTIKQYAKLQRKTPTELNQEQLLALHQSYEQLKDKRFVLDFEDVLLATVGMLEAEPRITAYVRQQYRNFMVDEFQDVSPIQHQLLQLWLGTRDELCVVGDSAQTIYSFAGAKPDFLLNFTDRYPNAKIIKLENNYRSSAEIVTLANRLVRELPGALELQSYRSDPVGVDEAKLRVPSLRSHADDQAEAEAVASAIGYELANNRPAAEIAVLYRMNFQSAALESALQQQGISYRVHGTPGFFEHPEVRELINQLFLAAKAETTQSLQLRIQTVFQQLGWSETKPEFAGAALEKWNRFNTILKLAERSSVGNLLDFVQELRAAAGRKEEPDNSAVTLATIHSAKGLEWDSVHLIGLSDGLLPSFFAKSEEELLEEQRLLYVAVTRARVQLQLHWSLKSSGKENSRQLSRFLSPIRGDRNILQQIDTH